MKKKMVYVVVLTENEIESRGYSRVLGVFSTKELAAECLDREFHRECDEFGIGELNNLSYYTEGDSFSLEGDDSEFMNECEITTIALDDNLLDEDASNDIEYVIEDIDWDADGDELDELPNMVRVPIDKELSGNELMNAIDNYLCDRYGYCVNGYVINK